ncbi:hypothetical protein Scep_001828 [Stephania cephalantha]|uniref:Uncharacterized protein n=1 Tax=Stephania cephalantha TaxID=152367 RepID=A0AAP0LA68_9MAGN
MSVSEPFSAPVLMHFGLYCPKLIETVALVALSEVALCVALETSAVWSANIPEESNPRRKLMEIYIYKENDSRIKELTIITSLLNNPGNWRENEEMEEKMKKSKTSIGEEV